VGKMSLFTEFFWGVKKCRTGYLDWGDNFLKLPEEIRRKKHA
jgi:hypothetical protein